MIQKLDGLGVPPHGKKPPYQSVGVCSTIFRKRFAVAHNPQASQPHTGSGRFRPTWHQAQGMGIVTHEEWSFSMVLCWIHRGGDGWRFHCLSSTSTVLIHNEAYFVRKAKHIDYVSP